MTNSTEENLFVRIGADALRQVIEDFYDRVLGDVMIGFLFHGKDRQRLVDKEWEFTANLLGADVRYTGRPIRQAHARSPILGGHFERRLQILRETLADHDVDHAVRDRWLQHTEALRPQVTADASSECDHEAAVARVGQVRRTLQVLGAGDGGPDDSAPSPPANRGPDGADTGD